MARPYLFTRWNNGDIPPKEAWNDLQAAIETLDGTGTTFNSYQPAGSGLKTGYLVCAADAPAFMKATADYVCDQVNDEVQWQAAIDAAQAAVVGGTYGAPTVYLSPGLFRLGAGVTAKSAPIVGLSASNVGTRVYWDGAAGATAITKSTAFAGSTTIWRMEHVEFSQGTAIPGVWLDLSAGGVDQMVDLHDVQFVTGSTAQIKMGGWVNCHWRKLRFDGWGTYAISLTPYSSQNDSTFMLDDFTSDNNPTAGGRAFLGLDTSASSTFNLGTLRLANGRIEMNQLLASPPAAIIELTTPNPGASRVVGFELENITYDDVVGNPSDVLLYSTTAATSISVSLVLINVRQNGLSAIFGGTLYSGMPTIPLQADYGLVAVGQGGTADATFGRLQIGGSPTVTSGAGAPTGAEPNGSIYLRTDGGATTTAYVRAGGAWSALT